jgi:GNAT superfamily N-acetyltransferase
MALRDLFVIRDHRNKNIGKQLMESVQKIMFCKSVSVIKWHAGEDNARAMGVYKSMCAELTIKGIFKWSFKGYCTCPTSTMEVHQMV